jgi:hypothetical protein
LKETVLEMLARVLKQDFSSTTCPTISPLIEMNTSTTGSDSTELCLSSILELILCGADVTERFVKRYASNDTNLIMKRFKICRFESPILNCNSKKNDHEIGNNNCNFDNKDNKAMHMTFQVDPTDDMYR